MLLYRLSKCLKAAVVGVVSIVLPAVFFPANFNFGDNLWQIPVVLFFISVSTLLLFEFMLRKYLNNSSVLSSIVLALVFAVLALGFYALPFKINQVNIELSFKIFLFMPVSFTIAGIVVSRIVSSKTLVILQKEI